MWQDYEMISREIKIFTISTKINRKKKKIRRTVKHPTGSDLEGHGTEAALCLVIRQWFTSYFSSRLLAPAPGGLHSTYPQV